MIRHRYLLFFVALLFGTAQCVREIPFELPEQPTRIVAISHFTDGQPMQVEVSLSQFLTDVGDPVIPEDADITIAVKGKFESRLMPMTDDGGRIFWQSRDPVVLGTEYSLAVRIGGFETVEATSAVPPPVALATVQVDTGNLRVIELPDGKLALRVPLAIPLAELPEANRFFAFALRHEIEIFEWVNGEQVPDEYYETDTKFLADGRTLTLVYDTPEKVVLVNENFWSSGRTALNLDAIVPFDPAYERPRRIFIEWRTLSEEFYRYHLSLARQGNNIPLNDPDALYNNIKGGYGNFSGYSLRGDTIAIPNVF
ncbi:MAG: DUF4249 family protein [Lewinellaceae bacterium]|nr:DUF4249 family protein [Lewinellaceae bacterium]